MNRILREMHRQENIVLLKARDYYFDIAKKLNAFKTTIVVLPSILLLVIYLLPLLGIDVIPKDAGELGIGILTTLVAFAVYLIDHIMQKSTEVSNQLRALYDHRVLGIRINPFLNADTDLAKRLQKARKAKDSPKYETWYSEVYCDNHYANVLCCQIDNLLYAKHAYKSALIRYGILLAVFFLLLVSAVVIALCHAQWITCFLIVFSAMEVFDVFIGKIKDLYQARSMCAEFCKSAKQFDPATLDQTVIDRTQEIVNKNRDLCIFLPRDIRKKFLKDGNPFYNELNEYKQKFMGSTAIIPESASEIEVVVANTQDTVVLRDMQLRLADMLKEVVRVFDQHGIAYVLDGGTLIGAMREGTQGFIFWDDDIDIAIRQDQIDKAKAALREHLDYVIQDAHSEAFYSPRLSVFKIREHNEQSMVAERDSALYTLYKDKGLFIDVYAYSPILISKHIDKLFRRLWIHPLNRKLEKVENGYYKQANQEKQHKTFFRLKKRYQKRQAFYSKHAHNTSLYAYFPGYVYDHKKPGPYIAAKDLFAKHPNDALWENERYQVPKNPDKVLTAYYGPAWATPPYKSKQELIGKHGEKNWFSKAPSTVTALKHISHLIHYNKQA